MKPKVIITHRLFDQSFVELEKTAEVIRPTVEQKRFSAETIRPFLGEIEALLPTYAFKVTRELIEAAPKLKIIANFGTGYDNIDVKAATEQGIVVCNNPDPVIEPTGEMAYALMLSLARRVAECDRRIREQGLKIDVMENLGTTLFHKNLGIVGYGKIGHVVARYAHASQMRIRYYNRHPLSPEQEQAEGVEYADMESLLRESDVITLHTPLSEATHHLIGRHELSLMKPTALLVNTSRGAVIDEEALIEALETHRLAGAALDVFEHEPRIPEALKAMDQVILAPHSGTATIETRIEMGRRAAENIIDFFQGKTERLTRVN